MLKEIKIFEKKSALQRKKKRITNFINKVKVTHEVNLLENNAQGEHYSYDNFQFFLSQFNNRFNLLLKPSDLTVKSNILKLTIYV